MQVTSEQPVELWRIGALKLDLPAADICLSGERAVVLCNGGSSSAVEIVSLLNPAEPSHMSTISGIAPAEKLAVSKGHAYLAAGEQGVLVVDVRDPFAPRVVTQLRIRSKALDLSATDRWLYVAAWSAGLAMYDLSDPAQPVRVATYWDFCPICRLRYPPWDIFRVAVYGDRIYVLGYCVTGFPELRFLKCWADAPPPRYLGGTKGRRRHCLAADDRGVYVGGENFLEIWGTGDDHLHFLGEMSLDGNVECCAISEGFLYVGIPAKKKLLVVDLRNPWNPQTALTISTNVSIDALAARGPLVLAASKDKRILVFWNSALQRKGQSPRPLDHAVVIRSVWPNPSGGLLHVDYGVAEESHTTLAVYDSRGRLVRHLQEGRQRIGEYRIRWDATDDAGDPLPSGIYLVRLRAGRQVAVRKVVLVR